MSKIIVLALLTACLGGGGGIPPRVSPTDANAKTVSRVVDYASEVSWRSSPYWRQEDQPHWPWFVVISDNNMACPVFEHELRVPQHGESYICKTNWRFKRNF